MKKGFWSDLLTSIGGQSLTADEIGNLLSDGTWTYTWQHGRQLAGMSKAGTNIAYGYDSDGKRISKIVDGTAYNYHYLGDQLVELTWGENKMHFTYDSTGPLSVNYNGTEYFYVKNAQGDVTGLVNASGTRVVTYTYDAWGNPLATTGSLAATLGEQNPLRYRGYVYDTETGLYYLQSRYYNPGWGRFINADSLIDNRGVNTQNVFAYCVNNPVNNADPSGHIVGWIIGGVIGGIIGGISGALAAICNGKSIGAGFTTGAITGALIGAICGAVADAISTGGLSIAIKTAYIAAASAASGIISASGNLGNQAWNYAIEKKAQASQTPNGRTEPQFKRFSDYVDVSSIICSGIVSALVTPLSLGANCLVNNAFNGCTMTGIEYDAAQFIANFAIGGNLSILQGIIDLF